MPSKRGSDCVLVLSKYTQSRLSRFVWYQRLEGSPSDPSIILNLGQSDLVFSNFGQNQRTQGLIWLALKSDKIKKQRESDWPNLRQRKWMRIAKNKHKSKFKGKSMPEKYLGWAVYSRNLDRKVILTESSGPWTLQPFKVPSWPSYCLYRS